jgi:hypothetical protein
MSQMTNEQKDILKYHNLEKAIEGLHSASSLVINAFQTADQYSIDYPETIDPIEDINTLLMILRARCNDLWRTKNA